MDIASAIKFCLGTGAMNKCKTCRHEAVWDALNELPDTERLARQSEMTRVDDTQCQITSGCYYVAVTPA